MKSVVSALLLAAAICAGDVGDACAAGVVGPVTGHTISSWTINDGIPLGAVYAIVQDTDGYLWVGTAAGVVRFDGARFTPWQSLHPDPLPRTAVYALHFANDGTLWAGFEADGRSVTVRGLRDGRAIASDAGTPPRGSTTCVFPDRTGAVWAVSAGVLHRWRNGRWQSFTGGPLPPGEVVSVGERANGDLWVGTRGGLFRFDREQEAFTLVEPGIVREFTETRDGTVWVTDAGRGARRLSVPRRPLGLEGLGMALLHDTRGNLWVATTGQGLWRVRDTAGTAPLLVEHGTAQTGLSSDAVESLFEDREGNIWVGTTQGLHSLTPHVLTPLRTGAFARTMLADADGTVWVGTANGLVRFRRLDGEWVLQRAGPTGVDVRGLSRDARGRVQVETSRSDTRGSRRIVDGRAIVHEHRDRHGNVFAGLEGGAFLIERAGGSRSVVEAPTAAAAEAQSIDAIYADRRGTIWVGGTRGLCRVSGETLACPGKGAGLPARRVFAMTEAGDEDLWLVVDRGPAYVGRRAALVRVSVSELSREHAEGAPLLAYDTYDAGQGLAGVPIGASIARAADGTIWVLSGGNLTVVDPRLLRPASALAPPRVRIEGATIDGEHVALTTSGALPPGTRRMEIDYTALRLTAPRQLRFRYRLDGFDSDWVDAGARRQAYYTNLAGGEYVFRVEATGEGNVWTQPAATWRFTVRPVFYQTAWFYSIVAVSIAVIGVGAWRTRLWFLHRQFAATIAERTRLSREIHDTMLQSLAGIALQCQAIASRCGPAAAREKERLLSLRREVEQHIREARQAVMDLRSPLLESRGLAGALDEVGRRLINGNAIALEIATPGFQAEQVSPAVERELLRIGQEAISNAIRHGEATEIRVDLRHEAGRVRLRVADNGRGFDAQAALSDGTGHYGVIGMRERATRLGGALVLTSAHGGTLVDVSVPEAAAPLAS